jgi:nickel/cobalt transporter (NiCoT) family protein
MFAFILAINVAGWAIFVLCIMPHHFDYKGVGSSPGLGVGLGVAITAWFLGFRHAFDADHISCIDNTTRKLMADGQLRKAQRPLGTGFFFSFGHSTVIMAVGVGITLAARAVFGAMVDPNSAYETAGGAIGTALSAGFLYLIALLNLIVLSGIFKVFREMRGGRYDEQELEAQLQSRGLMYRFFGRFMKSINHTWQLYFVGIVFGIGFDTATEVVLLAATAYAAIQGLPYYAVLALPFLFSGGMMLFDTLDGCFMNFAYGWAFAKPVRKVYYNLVITGLSIGAAFIIGTIEILGVLTSEVHLRGAFWNTMANFNINVAGFCIAAMFILVWAAALAYWRWGKVEDRWGASVAPGQAADPELPRAGGFTCRRYAERRITPGDRWPVGFPGIEGITRQQAGPLIKKRDPVSYGQVPAELREAAQHALGHFAPVASPAHLALGKPGSRWRHRDKVALVQDRHATPHDLRVVASPDFDVSEPDPVTVRVRTDLDDPPGNHASRSHKHGTVSPASRRAREADVKS